ncbi:solute carrier family 12 member 3-like isoform X1 [Daphnia pulicaria]|uniref:solute carrier family 12 member 3-like isoform X1 n=1 Tax=Daphnia pulicaria TaxID=35523 RepID=UPI001EE9D807|nr:solute carrier family 12 member 3-like isoform X1 [Daphnia pulicaria]XP_046651513.1 solute carrier family 12 member 3-like isoform X1 [Daphnia pulicaria]XP_046651514.1 solute carrier family 12 member 3-like isoform X1 [Daphnia pulicaria]XP_046651515.1 solute carrier family 12 member 3-like isoform X1 [Daphnia pulicaria]XP_046651517.1 solute carrier family 12 member 3-like isoform X1 [Daphnia pulicaria]
MDNKAFEDSIENEENCVVEEKVNNIPIDVISDTQVGKMKNETDASSSYRTGYQGQMEILPTLHELHNPAAESQQQQEMRVTKAREFADGSRFKVSTYVPTGIEMENIPQGSAQIGNDNSITGLTNRKGSVATVSSHDRNRKMSRDVIPSIEHYRTQPTQQVQTTVRRPTMNELCNPANEEVQLQHTNETTIDESQNEMEKEPVVETVKFGWIEGVLIRNMMSIWGVMLFLRLSWVVAQAGIGETLVIIAISTFITLVTALSMSAISTNGEIGGGGTYFVMSRVLGPEFGGSIGIIFAIANAMDCSLNVVGFAQALQDMMLEYGGVIIIDGADNDIRIIGTVTMIFITAICGLGSQYETKMKDIMFVIMLASLANFLAGSIMGPSSELEEARGFIGYSVDLLTENWDPAYTITGGQMQNFISVFSVYFPASIGILAGANVSGDLKNPNSAIPKGTILAIIICSISYAGVAIICAATVARQATGRVMDLANGTYLNCTAAGNSSDCTSGLYYDYQAMSLVSAFAPLNYVGCIAATISSALSDFVSCPALLEVIAADELYPYWMVGVWGKTYGKSKQPLRAFAFTFVLALAFVLIAQLDMIALLISDFFLATFALMNFSTFHVSLIKPIGWRPTFKYYNTWLSLLTGLLSVASMILISLPIAMITIGIVSFFYMVVLYRKPEVNWGSSTQAQTYRAALTSIQQLVHIEEHVKNYRPQILVLTGLPNTRPALVDFAYLICKNNSLMVCGNVVEERLTFEMRSKLQQKAYRYLRFTNIKGFCSVADNSNLHTGVAAMLGLSGVGKVKPNILMMGYKNDWLTCDKKSLDDYVLTIHTGFEMHVGVTILRLQEGLDCSEILADIDDLILNKLSKDQSSSHQAYEWSVTSNGSNFSPNPDSSNENNVNVIGEDSSFDPSERRRTVVLGTRNKKSKKSKKLAITFRDPEGNELPKSVMNKIILFQKKQKKDTIDIWWLSDDGGLTLLLPVIINSRSNWSDTRLRIFCTASGVHELEQEQQGMAVLLSKFRIDYSDLVIISDVDEAPKKKTKKWFDGLIRPFLEPRTNGPRITEEELEIFQYKTNRHLKLRELLLDHSSDSNMVVMTLPMPRSETLSAPLYMAWLEALTANMPPFMLVRGNQTSVLTFYV